MTIELTRRGFLGFLGTAAAAVIISPAAKIWVPEEQKIIMPEAFEAARSEGLICGWLMNHVPSDGEVGTLLETAFDFPKGVPLMVLARSRAMGRNAHRFNRFYFRGSGDPRTEGAKFKVLASWANAEALALRERSRED